MSMIPADPFERGYRRILGGLAWPHGSLPGAAVVVAEEHIPDTKCDGKCHLLVLAEAEEGDMPDLYARCLEMQREHGATAWLGFPEHPLAEYFHKRNRAQGIRSQRGIVIYPAVQHEEIAAIRLYDDLIRARLQVGKKSLTLGRGSNYPGHLERFGTEDLSKHRADHFPAFAALGYVVAEMDLVQPIIARPVGKKDWGGWV
jgi:hypothetical protein